MPLTPQEEATIKTYDSIARDFAQRHGDRDFYRSELAKFKQLLPEGKILEIGCGPGKDASDLITSGYEYVGIDPSKGLLEIARENNPGVTFLEQNVEEMTFEPDSFDGFWASAVLLHIPKDKINKALSRIHEVVKTGGIGFISMHQGEGEELRNNEKGERFFSYYSLTEFSRVLELNRFKIIEAKTKTEENEKVWLYIFVEVVE